MYHKSRDDTFSGTLLTKSKSVEQSVDKHLTDVELRIRRRISSGSAMKLMRLSSSSSNDRIEC